jgi:HAE1 family hydrophobic/amphiphilic exporter-1
MVALFHIRLNLFPEVDYPSLTVLVPYPNSTPSEIEKLVIRPLEEIVSSINGLKQIKSISQEGLGIVILYFGWDVPRDRLYMETREKLDAAKAVFPKETGRPVVLQQDPSSLPIMQIGVKFFNQKMQDNSRYFVRKNLVPLMEQIKGVGRVEVIGGKEKEVKIIVDISKLYSRNISLQTIASVVGYNNMDYPVGYIEEGKKEILIKVKGKLSDYMELENIVVGYGKNGEVIRLKDIASIRMGYKEENTKFLLGEEESILMNVYLEGGENIVNACENVREKLSDLNNMFQGKAKLDILNSQDEEVKSSIVNIVISAFIGMVLTSLILLLFLNDFYFAFVVSLIIPLSVVCTLFFMYLLKISFNLISLQGLALVIGMIVDSNIVVVENVNRIMEENPKWGFDESLLRGVNEVRGSVFNSILTNVAVFFPLIFAAGLTGVLFKELAIVVTIALFASLFISLSFTPSLLKLTKVLVLKRRAKIKKNKLEVLNIWYERALNFVLRLKKRTFLGFCIILVLISLAYIFFAMEKEIFPRISRRVVVAEYQLPASVSLEQNKEVAFSLISNLKEKYKEEMDKIYAIVGERLFYDAATTEKENNKTKIWLIFKRIASEKLVKNISTKLKEFLPDESEFVVYEEPISIEKLVPQASRLQSINFSSENREFLRDIVKQAELFLKERVGVSFIRKSSEEKEFYNVNLDRFLLSSYGLSPYSIASTLNNFIYGSRVGVYYSGDEEIDIRVKGYEGEIQNMENIYKIPIDLNGKQIPLGMFATITNKIDAKKLYRINQKSMEYVEFMLSSTRKLNDVEKWISKNIDKEIVSVESSWKNKEVLDSIRNLFFLLILSVVLIILLLVFQFETFIDPFIILSSIIFIAPGICLIGMFTGISLNISSMLGLILLSGVVVNNGIVLIEFYKKDIKENVRNQNVLINKIVSSSKKRLRPILMTSLTTILSLIPLTIGQGEGFDFQRPLSLTIVGGMLFSTFITLFIVPYLFFIINKKRSENELVN